MIQDAGSSSFRVSQLSQSGQVPIHAAHVILGQAQALPGHRSFDRLYVRIVVQFGKSIRRTTQSIQCRFQAPDLFSPISHMELFCARKLLFRPIAQGRSHS